MHERTVHHDMSLKFASGKHRSEVNSITYSNLTIQEHISIGPSPVIFLLPTPTPSATPLLHYRLQAAPKNQHPPPGLQTPAGLSFSASHHRDETPPAAEPRDNLGLL